MAKEVYKIPDSIDKNHGDVAISISTDKGVGVKPIPIKYLLGYFVSIMVGFFILTKSFIAQAGGGRIFIFGATWVALTGLMFRRDDTGLAQYNLVGTMLNYLPKKSRRITTRTTSKANDFYYLVGIDTIDPKTGLITHLDGTVSYMYRVVGSASILLFDSDRNAILDRVATFYRNMKTDYELIFITTRESQKIHKQIANLKYRYDNLEVDDQDLKDIANMEYRYLRDHVGGTYRSIHQYLMIKADNIEALTVAKNVLRDEVENGQMFKQCTALNGREIIEVQQSIYRGKESI